MGKPILEWSDAEVISYSDELAHRVMRKDTTAGDVRIVHEMAVRLKSATGKLSGRADLASRLNDEADLCANEGADDIAKLLWEAAAALHP